MNMQNLMREAQKMQAELMKTQKELENTEYKINGKKEIVSLKINAENDIEKDDIELLEDMILTAINEAMKKADNDKSKKLNKYGNGIAGLM